MTIRRFSSTTGLSALLLVVVTLIASLSVSSSPIYSLQAASVLQPVGVQEQGNCIRFSETGKALCGRFLEYWNTHGGVARHGFPISEELQEQSAVDRKTYTVQYFERSIFEYHPENQPPYDVLLSLLGRLEYKKQWPGPYYPIQTANTSNPLLFRETGKTMGGAFGAYWEQNGGLSQYGYPVTNEFEERSLLDGKMYTVQYFERAVFELHPENQPPYNVLLSQLGRFQYDALHNNPTKATQTPARLVTFDECSNAKRQKGTVIARGNNTTPTEKGNLKTYQIEEVRLAEPVDCGIYLIPGKVFSKYWRVTIYGDEPFVPNPTGSSSLSILLDNKRLGPTVGARDGYRTVVYDFAPLKDGGVLGLGYGNDPPDYQLPERVEFNREP